MTASGGITTVPMMLQVQVRQLLKSFVMLLFIACLPTTFLYCLQLFRTGASLRLVFTIHIIRISRRMLSKKEHPSCLIAFKCHFELQVLIMVQVLFTLCESMAQWPMR